MSVAVVAVLALVVVVLGACEPPPPRAQFTVTTNTVSSDRNRGDGVCAALEPGAPCTLLAAIQEANTIGAADITLPAGTGFGTGSAPVTVTGDVSITGAGIPYASGTYLTNHDLRVAAGGKLRLSNLVSYSWTNARFVAAGQLDLHRVGLGGFGASLTIPPGGTAIVVDSAVTLPTSTVDPAAAVEVAGSLVMARSYFNAHRLRILDGGSMLTTGNIAEVGECVTPPPESFGYVWNQSPGCLSHPTDTVGIPNTDLEFWIDPDPNLLVVKMPKAGSSLVDAVPLGTAGCSTALVDLFGNPRGGDGNGDGIPGCDLGPVERQPAPAAEPATTAGPTSRSDPHGEGAHGS